MRYIGKREDLASVAPRVESERKGDGEYDGQVPGWSSNMRKPS